MEDERTSEITTAVEEVVTTSAGRAEAGATFWRQIASGDLPKQAYADALPFLVDALDEAPREAIQVVVETVYAKGWDALSRAYLPALLLELGEPPAESAMPLVAFSELQREAPRHDEIEEELIALLHLAFESSDSGDLLDLVRRKLPAPVFSRLCALAASQPGSCITTRPQLGAALESARADEAIRIILQVDNPALHEFAWSELDRRREAVAHALLGLRRPLVLRIFGPTPGDVFVGTSGLLGFGGVAAATLTAFVIWLTPVSTHWIPMIFTVLFLAIRALLVRDLAPKFDGRQLLALSSSKASAGLVLAWACRRELEHGRAQRLDHLDALATTLEDAPGSLLERARVVCSTLDRDLVHTAPRTRRARLVSSVRELSSRIDRERRMLSGISHQDPTVIASALREIDSRGAALRALPRAPANPALLEAVLEELARRPDELALWHYGLRAQIGADVRLTAPQANHHQSYDNALATLAARAEIGGVLSGARLVWSSHKQLSVDAQRAFFWMLERESRTSHSVELMDLATHLLPESKSRTLEVVRRDRTTRFELAALGSDPELYDLGATGGEDAALILRRNAGPAAALGLWRLASRGTARERRQAWTALEELADRYGFGLFELIDESVASVRKLRRDQWVELSKSRLSQAMIGRRRWRAREWRRAIGRPEILREAQGLVWASFDLYGRVIGTFRIDESLELVDIEHREWRLQGHQLVGIPAALDLDEEIRREWSELMADFEIHSPFDQLSHPEHVERIFRSSTFESLVEETWIASHPDDERVFSFLRPFFELDATGVIEVEPGLADEDEPQVVVHIGFIDGIHFVEPAVPLRADEESDPNGFSAARRFIQDELSIASAPDDEKC